MLVGPTDLQRRGSCKQGTKHRVDAGLNLHSKHLRILYTECGQTRAMCLDRLRRSLPGHTGQNALMFLLSPQADRETHRLTISY